MLWPYRRRLVDRSLWVRTEQERLQRRLAIYMPESSVSPPHDRDTESLWDATQRYVAAMAEVTRERGGARSRWW
ncbi:hypothetical protein C2W62_50830 [Candidatus Entotheonella serta]|nr:hypothetical protein C2W62_50830 [Candidatus Entotheonella serta]